MIPSSKTLVCASIAKSGRTSNAPFMHNVGFQHLNLDYVYVSFEPDDIGKAIEAVRTLDLPGGSISAPYKESVVEHLDGLDPIAKSIGAVNSFRNENGRIVGYNSDWVGANQAIEEVIPLEGKRVAVVGAGGVGRAIVFGLMDRGAEVTVFNRTKERGLKLAKDSGSSFGGTIEDLGDYNPQVLVNATSVGMLKNDSLLVDDSVLAPLEALLDVSSSPWPTKLAARAERHGCTVIRGLRMSVLQGAFTFELITGKKAPIEVMYKAALSKIKN